MCPKMIFHENFSEINVPTGITSEIVPQVQHREEQLRIVEHGILTTDVTI